MEEAGGFVAGIVFVLFIEFIAYKILSKKYEIVKLPDPPASSGGGGGGSRPDKEMNLK